MTNSLVMAYKFFRRNAGGWVGHNAENAIRLARAEAWMETMGVEYSIVPDENSDLSWMTERERQKDHEVVGVCLRHKFDELPYSLWNIVDADSAYLRVVVAELAMEAMAADWSPAMDESEELTLA